MHQSTIKYPDAFSHWVTSFQLCGKLYSEAEKHASRAWYSFSEEAEREDEMSQRSYLFRHSSRQHIYTLKSSWKKNNAISGADEKRGVECLLRVYQIGKLCVVLVSSTTLLLLSLVPDLQGWGLDLHVLRGTHVPEAKRRKNTIF